ncbi:carbohydrate porin [Thalassotalea nanhaiensis]|uniref:Carbohydrate porin n=1 Tax=Thalassotalea nanhaiensis TaxID=3065648 RepID=A0ABY9TEZ8_9GAMM|nr:carbohydrate porin [Colwelliaceae bacterium SQ345]
MSVKMKSAVALAISLAISPLAFAEDGQKVGSPDSTEHVIEDNKHAPRISVKERLEKDYGLSLSADYNAFGITSGDTMEGTDDSAASGVFRLMGSWAATENGSLNFKIEHRHAYTDEAPKMYGINNIGMSSLSGAAFNDQGARVTNLYWRQNFNDGNTVVWAGFMDITDYLDAYAQASPWTDFSNLVFSTGSGTMALPDDAAFGMAAAHMITDNVYVLGGIADASGMSDMDEMSENVDKFLNDEKHHKSIELGYTGAGKSRIYLDNVHVTYWHQDGGTRHDNNASGDDSEGVNFSASFMMGKWMPFIRGGVSEGSAPMLEQSLVIGTGYYGLLKEGDTLGVAANWGKVNKEAFGTDQNQYIGQVYYKIPVTDYLQLIPDVQYVRNGAISNEEDQVIIGLRARIIL